MGIIVVFYDVLDCGTGIIKIMLDVFFIFDESLDFRVLCLSLLILSLVATQLCRIWICRTLAANHGFYANVI